MESHPIVSINQGTLRGKVNKDYEGNPYYSFQGIPYAEPPLGNLRFKAPQPPQPWEGIYDATQEQSQCYSRDMMSNLAVGSEDCLFLNVFTPQLPDKSKCLKSVMVWIHGGAFVMGSGGCDLYGPEFFMPKDVIVVTINYRLGLLGFLSLDDPNGEISGNAGLKDQVMALRWVQNNISKFGGNPNNVTIFGESAGAVSVHFLMLSPTAKGLFHAAIMQSGCVFVNWSEVGSLIPHLAKILALEEQEVLGTLISLSVEKMLELQEKLPQSPDVSEPAVIWPVIEKTTAKIPFITQQPLDIIISGNYNHVPAIIGFTSREGMLFEAYSKRYHGEVKFITDFEGEIPSVMNISKGSNLSKSIAEQIKQFYYGNEVSSQDNINQYYLLKGDSLFVAPTYTMVKHHCSTSHEPVYLYRITVETSLNMFKKREGITNPGVCHGDDLAYLFKNAFTPPIIPNSTEDKSIQRFTTLWTTFAKTGNPNSANDDVVNIEWLPVKPDEFHFMNIGDSLTIGINPEQDRMAFWKEIFSKSPSSSNLL